MVIASEKTDSSKTYQQALDDFGITDLLAHLSNYCDGDFNATWMNVEQQELESLAALLIQQLTKSLKGKRIASYLNAIRHGDAEILFDPTHLDIPPASPQLAANFPSDITPRYAEGDRVGWRLNQTTDSGVVIGRFYAYARHQCQWAIGYLIWLDPDSPSAAWIGTDTAWEDDLEAIPDPGWETHTEEEGENVAASLDANPIPLTLFSYLQTHTPTTEHALHSSSGRYKSGGNGNNPRTLTQREQNLIDVYSNCQLGMTPQRFYSKWSVSYEQLASICSRSTSTVRYWFARGCNYRRPTANDLRHLALMDFLLEHFEEIPQSFLNLLCFSNRLKDEASG